MSVPLSYNLIYLELNTSSERKHPKQIHRKKKNKKQTINQATHHVYLKEMYYNYCLVRRLYSCYYVFPCTGIIRTTTQMK